MKLRWVLVLLVGIAFVFSSGFAEAADGEVTMKITTVALGFGHSKGEGTLTFKGKEYPFTVGGLGMGSVGISSAKFKGSASNLKEVSDFEGTYFGGHVGLATGGGDTALRVTNNKDVVLTLFGSEEGFKASLGSKGLKIKLK